MAANRHVCMRHIRALLVTGPVLVSMCSPIAAQVPAPIGMQTGAAASSTATAADATPAAGSLESEVAGRSEALGADPTIDPATRDAAIARLREAQNLLQAAAADRVEAQRLQAERETAPALLSELAGRQAAEDGPEQPSTATPPPAAPEPEEWSGLSLAQIEIAVAEADNAMRAARQGVAESNRKLGELRRRRPLFGADLAEARDAVAAAADKTAQVSTADLQTGGTGSELLLSRARQQAHEARLALLQELSSGADVREQLLLAQASAAERDAKRSDERLRALRTELARRRLADAVAQSSEWRESPVGGYEAVAAIAESNRELAGLYGGASSVTRRIDQVQRDLANLEHTIAEFQSDAKVLRARLDGLDRTFAAGILIREGIERLPSVAAHQDSIERRRVVINETQLRVVDLANQLRRLERDLPGESSRVVATLTGLAAADRDEAVRVVGDLLEARRRVLQPLQNDLDELLNGLVELQARERVLLQDVQDTGRHLRSREPWVRNGRRVFTTDMPAALAGLVSFVMPSLWSGSGAAAAAAVAERPQRAGWVVAMIVVAASVLVALHRRRRRTPANGTPAEQRARPAAVLGAAVLSGLAWLLIVVSAGWWLAGIVDAPVALGSLGRSLQQIVLGVFMVGFMRALFSRSGGAASVNPALAATADRGRPIPWYLVALFSALVISGILWTAGAAGIIEHGQLGARLALLIAALLMAIGIHRAMRGRARDIADTERRGSYAALGFYAVAASIPLIFGFLLVQGFTIAAYDLVRALLGTVLVLFVAGIVRMLFLRADSADPSASSEWSSLREGRLDLLHVMVTLAVLAGLFVIWRNVFTDLLYLQNVPLWTAETAEGLKTVTVANLLACLTVLGGTLIAFWALPLIVGTEASNPNQRNIGTRYAAVALARYTVLIVGLVAAFSLLNIGWSKLQWMAAGLSVGLGFGLQETAANLFSGLTLLSERSIRVGDIVTVGERTGIVRRIKVRATTVEDFDGREIVIPNKDLVSNQVINWTLRDAKQRLQVMVGVAYGSDTALVVQKLLEAAAGIEGIIDEPPPQAVFEQFGDSALQFRLYAWMDSAQGAVRINHDLHMRIEQIFRASGIAMDFPQRDVHLFPAGPFEVRLRTDTP
jgi:potassium efflux system protein